MIDKDFPNVSHRLSHDKFFVYCFIHLIAHRKILRKMLALVCFTRRARDSVPFKVENTLRRGKPHTKKNADAVSNQDR